MIDYYEILVFLGAELRTVESPLLSNSGNLMFMMGSFMLEARRFLSAGPSFEGEMSDISRVIGLYCSLTFSKTSILKSVFF